MSEITLTSLKFLAPALIKARPPISIYSISFLNFMMDNIYVHKSQCCRNVLNIIFIFSEFINSFFPSNTRNCQEANLAKLLSADAQWLAAETCLQTHGGFGFAEEFDVEKQVGSSTMAHKRNPITAENACGLARVVRAMMLPTWENALLN